MFCRKLVCLDKLRLMRLKTWLKSLVLGSLGDEPWVPDEGAILLVCCGVMNLASLVAEKERRRVNGAAVDEVGV